MNTKIKITLFGVVWILGICFGIWQLLKYENSPGINSKPPVSFPKNSSLKTTRGIPTLIVFVHPHCPCTRATISELAQILTRRKEALKTYVVFFRHSKLPVEWVKTDLWEYVERMKGVEPIIDEAGKEMKIFNVLTSGHSLLYDEKGKLVFSGGITASRGHVGNNIGRSTVVALLNNKTLNTVGYNNKYKVFGCPLVKTRDK